MSRRSDSEPKMMAGTRIGPVCGIIHSWFDFLMIEAGFIVDAPGHAAESSHVNNALSVPAIDLCPHTQRRQRGSFDFDSRLMTCDIDLLATGGRL